MTRKALLRVLHAAAVLIWPLLFILSTADPAW